MAVVVSGRKGSGVRRTDSYRDRKLLELEEKLSEVCKQNETLLKKVNLGNAEMQGKSKVPAAINLGSLTFLRLLC